MSDDSQSPDPDGGGQTAPIGSDPIGSAPMGSDPVSPGPVGQCPPMTFLVVVDESEEMHQALRFACVRARATGGRVVLARVVEPPDFQHFGFVGQQMQREAHEDAERLLQRLAAEVQKRSGRTPVVTVREGKVADQLVQILEEDPEISLLVLAARSGKKGPGPLISGLAGSFGARLRVPAVVVPPGISDEELDRFG